MNQERQSRRTLQPARVRPRRARQTAPSRFAFDRGGSSSSGGESDNSVDASEHRRRRVNDSPPARQRRFITSYSSRHCVDSEALEFDHIAQYNSFQDADSDFSVNAPSDRDEGMQLSDDNEELGGYLDTNGNADFAREDEVEEVFVEEAKEPEPVLISIDSLRHGVFTKENTVTIRVPHKDIDIEQIVLHEDSFELHFTSSNPSDSKLTRHLPTSPDWPPSEAPRAHHFLWHIQLPEKISPDNLVVSPDGLEFTMRKASDSSGGSRELGSRLSASTSSIRARDYSRSYAATTPSYRYTPSSSSNASHYSTLSRSPSVAPATYHRSLFSTSSTGAAGRDSSSAMSADRIRDSLTSSRPAFYSPLKYSHSSYSTSSHSASHSSSSTGKERERERESSSASAAAPTSSSLHPNSYHTQSTAAQPTTHTLRSRSSSAVGSYRTVNVAEYTRQAAEREKWERDREEQRTWDERDKERQANAEPLVKDFRRKSGSNTAGATSMLSVNQTSSHAGSPAPSSSSSRYSPAPPAYEPSSSASISSYLSSSAAAKPMAKVTPYEERGTVVPPGHTGLRNIGNTCFMNATLQMLVNCMELKTYFNDEHYKMDVNVHNPLGFKGRLAEAFADFMRQMWSCTSRAIEPARIKELVAEKASQFANFAQHDAHEFLSFLLDGLHEDLNRVKVKTMTSTVEADGRPDIEVANEAWGNHLQRNNSIFVDLFHGQLKSRLQCPKCDRVSITFDPFVYLPVPFPKMKKSTTLYFWPLDPLLKPVKMTVYYGTDGKIYDLLSAVSDATRAPVKTLRLIEVVSHRLHKCYKPEEKTSLIGPGDLLYVFQLHSPSDCNEDVVELNVLQRQLYSTNLRYICSNCGESRNKTMESCTGCYNAYYCDEECRRVHSTGGGHREECGRRGNTAFEAVGQPFIVSLPRSHCTRAHLFRVLEARSRFSVDIFQPPIMGGGATTLHTSSSFERDENAKNSRKSVSPGPPASRSNGTTSNGAPPAFCTPASSSNGPEHQEQRENGERQNGHASPGPQRRQTVLPEQRARASRGPDSHMFIVRTVKNQQSFQGENINYEEEDDLKRNEPLNLPTGSFISINWINIKNGKPFVNVETRKQLDLDEEKGRKYAAMTAGNGSGGSSGGDPTLHEMLGMFSETERLKPEESWYCSRCKDHVEATKRLELYRLPPILIVQLKRFVYTAALQYPSHRRSKDERRVVYPLTELDLRPYLAEGAHTELEPVYDLTGVVCHSGSSYFGHYISMGRLAGFDASKTEIDWRTFDDSIVTRVHTPAQQAQSDDAYLLFYKQRGYATRSIFTRHYSFDPANLGCSGDPTTNGTAEGKHYSNGY